MSRIVLVALGVVLTLAGVALAQIEPVNPTPGALTILPTPTIDPFPADTPEDPRLSVCPAPALAGFAPYFVRPGDRLADLLTGAPNVSITQVAALNCLDDPASLPVGAVIWLPAGASVFAASAQPAAASAREPGIMRLEAEDDPVPNQIGTTVRWEATGTAAYFYPCSPNSNEACERPAAAQSLPLSHTLTLRDFKYAGPVRYRLEVGGGGVTVTQDLVLNIVCAQQSLAPLSGLQRCPQGPPRAVFGAWQAFERGVMLWFSDSDQIWVMTTDDHRVQVFNDIYDSQPDPDNVAPEGLFTPVMGFGQIWLLIGGPESAVGWGATPSHGLDILRQPGGELSYTTYIQGPDDIVYAVTLIPGTDAAFWKQVAG